MSNVLDRNPVAAAQSPVMGEAVAEVLLTLRQHMKPKARKAARADLEAFAERLETWQGCRLPANVTPIRGPRLPAEHARASEAQRRERAELAAAIRHLIGSAV